MSKGGAVFSKVAELWLADIRPSTRESTYTRYHRNVEKYLFPTFAEEYTHNIDHDKINAYIDTMLESGGMRGEGLSIKTMLDILSVLRLIITFGNSHGYKFGDTSNIQVLKRQATTLQTLDPDTRNFLEHVLFRSKDPTALGMLLALFTGMRVGEICALRWCDIDTSTRSVKISHTVARIADLSESSDSRTKLVITDPLSKSSSREIPLPSFLAEHLEKFRASDEEYIVCAALKPIEPCTFYVRYRAIMRVYGLGDYPFKTLRHTFATRCVEQGVDTRTLSEILGHADVSTTLAIYVHPTIEREQKRSEMEKLTPEYVKYQS